MKMQKFFILYIFLCVQVCLGNQHIRYIGIEKGLSNNAVTSLYKDRYGFMWFGTYDGLNRYDGTTFRTYRNVWGDTSSLIDNHINKIVGLGQKIFVGTLKGLVFYDYTDAKFHPVVYSNGSNYHVSKITAGISALCATNSGKIFIGTDNAGFFIYDVKGKIARHLTFNKSYSYTVAAVTCTNKGQILLFINNVGLCCLAKNGKEIMVLNRQTKAASSLTTDLSDRVWVGTDSGLFQLDLRSGKSERYQLPDPRFASINIADLTFSGDGHLWVATDGGGVWVIDPAKHQIISRFGTAYNPSIVKSDAISALLQDEQGRLWIATLRGGINVIDNEASRFNTVSHNPFNFNSVVNNFSLSFCEDEQGNLWIGTDGGGVSYWMRKQKLFKNYTHSDDQNTIASNFAVSIVKDRKNRIWIGLFNGGIDRFDKNTGRFIHYSCYDAATGVEDKNLWKLYIDKEDRLWAGTTRGGALYKYNPARDKFELFDSRLTNIHALCEDAGGNLWGGDYSRLIKIDVTKRKHEFIPIKNAVRSIVEDHSHHLWIGTEGGGLLHYDPDKKELKRYTQKDGLASNSILNVLIDEKGNLWGSTYNGLTEYIMATGKFRNFYASDGLQSNQFNFNAAAKLSSGELVFGGINGFNIFFPDSLNIKTYQPSAKLTDVKVGNESIEGSSFFTKGHALVDLKEITVPFDKATVAINYTAPEYSFADKLTYAYYLEGWDHGWNYVGNLRTAYYTRLDEGEYTLHIRVSNTQGNWNPHELLLHIRVLPPWYRTWVAYCLYFSLTISLIYAFWRYRIRQTRLKYEVEIATLKMEREKEINEKKLSFFTNVAHEFRTPLTLIINPIKDLLKRQHNQDNAELTTIYRNSRRLLGLVDHLLLFHKTESENDKANLSTLNFAALCRDVYLCFSQQAKFKNISYQFYCSNENIMVALDREKIEIAIFNLISNAIKFTPTGGEIQVNIDETGDNVVFEVSDTGCGIADDIGEKLFDKFYQVRNNTKLKTGFGIGLYLVKTFVELHTGRICYRKNKAGGTTFTIDIPKKYLDSGSTMHSYDDGQHLIDELIINHECEPEKAGEEEANDLELLISDKQSILIIDDNSEIRGYIKKIFKEEYKIYEADSGEAGLETIRKHLPDVVISDIIMGQLSGIDLCKAIKQDTSISHIPVILMTGDSNPVAKLKGIEVGAVDFVTKPFEKDILEARVQSILRDRRELQNYFYNEVTLKSNPRNISEHHKDFLYKCIAIIENYLMDPEFDVKTVADEMGMSYSSLFKRIKTISGLSVNNFVRFIRLRKAAELMINTNCNVNEAALNAGFSDIKYFRSHFVKQFGVRPSEFIKKHRSAFNNSTLHKNFKN